MYFEEDSELVIRWYYDETKIWKDINNYRQNIDKDPSRKTFHIIDKSVVKNNLQFFTLLPKYAKEVGFRENIGTSYNMGRLKMQLTITIDRDKEKEVKSLLEDFSNWLIDVMKHCEAPIMSNKDVEFFLKKREVEKSCDNLHEVLPTKECEKENKKKIKV